MAECSCLCIDALYSQTPKPAAHMLGGKRDGGGTVGVRKRERDRHRYNCMTKCLFVVFSQG